MSTEIGYLLNWVEGHPDSEVTLSKHVDLADADIFRLGLTVVEAGKPKATTYQYVPRSELGSPWATTVLDRLHGNLAGSHA